MKSSPNQISGPNAGGPRELPIPTPLTARVGQFHRCDSCRPVVLAAAKECHVCRGIRDRGCAAPIPGREEVA